MTSPHSRGQQIFRSQSQPLVVDCLTAPPSDPMATTTTSTASDDNNNPSSRLFLSFPSDDPGSTSSEQMPAAMQQERERNPKKLLLKDRLYVGNLHPTVDEYTLLNLFTKYGTITSLDYLFHKTGPMRGKPRGFAFVEFAEHTAAQKALSALHDKLLRGRKLVVTHAHQAPLDPVSSSGIGIGVTGGRAGRGGGTSYRRGAGDIGKPTTLSLLKSGRGEGPNPKDKIAMMEAKLRQMGSLPSSSVVSSPNPDSSTSASASTSHLHPSLPPKPPPSISISPAAGASSLSHTDHPSMVSGFRKPTNLKPKNPPLPSLPILPASHSQSQTRSTTDFASSLSSSYTPSAPISASSPANSMPTPPPSASAHPTTNTNSHTAPLKSKVTSRGSGLGLLGVKIVKKDKEKEVKGCETP